MPETYLQTAYKDREKVKALGARWDAAQRQWFVPEGRDLAPFAPWLPGGVPVAPTSALAGPTTDLALPARGVTLSQLLAGVAQAVAQAYRSGEWVRVEVVKADVRRGHVYLELTERSPAGDSLAQARAMIWAETANQIVPRFEQATGVVLGAGIKLLVRAKPTLSPQYGLSLVIDAIDPDYTLGDLEAKKREIRARLQREGLFDNNRALPAPWDFNEVLVVAPQGAAGLGDFQAEADRLQHWGLCRFTVLHSRFQGEGAAAEVRQALLAGLDRWAGTHEPGSWPDAVVIIRGGGAVNDLAWLNDYELARCLCELPVPVLTGIGHERDRTVLDDVAHTSYDTPSKVIAGIEQLIARRAQAARANYELVLQTAQTAAQRTRRVIEQTHLEVRSNALLAVRDWRDRAGQHFQSIRHESLLRLAQAKLAVPAALDQIRTQARQSLLDAKSGAAQNLATVVDRAGRQVVLARERGHQAIAQVAEGARRQVAEARRQTEATMREIAGQGPDKTLGRGFAMVRTPEGAPLTDAEAARAAGQLQIQFRDGAVAAAVQTLPKGTT